MPPPQTQDLKHDKNSLGIGQIVNFRGSRIVGGLIFLQLSGCFLDTEAGQACGRDRDVAWSSKEYSSSLSPTFKG